MVFHFAARPAEEQPLLSTPAHGGGKTILAIAGKFCPMRHQAFLLEPGGLTKPLNIRFAIFHGLAAQPLGGNFPRPAVLGLGTGNQKQRSANRMGKLHDRTPVARRPSLRAARNNPSI